MLSSGGGRALCENEHANEGPNARSSAALKMSRLCVLGLGRISEVLFVNQRGENGEEPIRGKSVGAANTNSCGNCDEKVSVIVIHTMKAGGATAG